MGVFRAQFRERYLAEVAGCSHHCNKAALETLAHMSLAVTVVERNTLAQGKGELPIVPTEAARVVPVERVAGHHLDLSMAAAVVDLVALRISWFRHQPALTLSPSAQVARQLVPAALFMVAQTVRRDLLESLNTSARRRRSSRIRFPLAHKTVLMNTPHESHALPRRPSTQLRKPVAALGISHPGSAP